MAVKIRSFESNVAALRVGILFDEEREEMGWESSKTDSQTVAGLQYFMTKTRHEAKTTEGRENILDEISTSSVYENLKFLSIKPFRVALKGVPRSPHEGPVPGEQSPLQQRAPRPPLLPPRSRRGPSAARRLPWSRRQCSE